MSTFFADKAKNMKLPPYAKPLYELITSGFHPNNDINVFIGNKAWNKGKAFSVSFPERTCLVPPWDSPCSYYWPVNNCDILVVDTGYANSDYLYELAECLYEHCAKIVRVISPDFKLSIYHKEVSL